jgi:ABC-2 type transport system ATP-binding protein
LSTSGRLERLRPRRCGAGVVEDVARPLVVNQVAKPVAGQGEIVVRIQTSGRCHTDIHAAHGDWPVKPSPPFIPAGRPARETMIELQQLTKGYGDLCAPPTRKLAVDGISATIRPGVVTGFLGPNGAGKSTTMRMILGLDRPTSGAALVNGRPYVDSPAPLAEVGALLDAGAVESSRSARNHLLALGATVGIGPRRVDDVLASVGLTEVAHKSAGSFSLGMGQRLGIAAALLADPAVLILDEPVNGLDLDGIQWIRALVTELAQEGRTVLLSSHLMSEMQLVADHLLIIGQGRILADTSMDDFIEHASGGGVVVASPDAGALAPLLAADGVTLTSTDAGRFEVGGLTADVIGDIAAGHGLRLHELAPRAASLESAYLELTRDSVEFAAA